MSYVPDIAEFCFSGDAEPETLLAIWCSRYMTAEEKREFRRMMVDILKDGERYIDEDQMLALISMAKFVAS